jgi:hypothetical protein
MSCLDELQAEIRKWGARLDERLQKVTPSDGTGERMIRNARAYREDSHHFLNSGDLVKSFECLIWAWAFLEIGLELGHLKLSS